MRLSVIYYSFVVVLALCVFIYSSVVWAGFTIDSSLSPSLSPSPSLDNEHVQHKSSKSFDIDAYYSHFEKMRNNVQKDVKRSDEVESFVVGSVWTASEGQSIKEVLKEWSSKAGIKFLWDTENEFSVLADIKIKTEYENAVSILLGQYTNDNMRPVGTLYVESQNEQSVLVIQDIK